MPDTLGIPGTGQPGSPVYHGGAGARNRGLGNEGFHLLAGKDYEGYLYAIAPAPPPPQPGAPPPPPPLLEVSLEGDGQRILAAQRFVVSRANWTKLSFSLTPNETTSCSSGAGDPSVYCGTYEGLPSPGHACVKCGGGLQVRRSMHQDCLLNPRNFVSYPFFTHFPAFFAHFLRLGARNPENTTRSPGENGKKSRKIG